MRSLISAIAAGVLVLGTSAATATTLPVTATLQIAIGGLPPGTLQGNAAAASSAGLGGAATLPVDSISGLFSRTISPPLLTLFDGIGVAAPGISFDSSFQAAATPAINHLLVFNGTTGTMGINASAYLLMAGNTLNPIPLGVVGVGGTQMFLVLGLLGGTIHANPYQLGMLTLMGAVRSFAPHTLMATGVDNRTAGGQGTLVLVSPTTVNLFGQLPSSPPVQLGTVAIVSTLTLNYGVIPEPGTLLLLGAGVAALAIGRRRMA